MSADVAMSGSGVARVPHDAYFTEAAAVIALMRQAPLPRAVWEPFAGAGHIARVLRAHGRHQVYCTDLVDYGFALDEQFDFFARPGYEPPALGNYAIVTNPPFDQEAERFVDRALALGRCSVLWVLLRNEWDCAGEGLAREFARRGLVDDPRFFRKLVLRWRLQWETPAGPIVSARTGEPEGPRHNYAWYGWNLAAPVRRSAGHDGARILYADRPLMPGDVPARAPQIPKAPPRRHWQDKEEE